MSKTATKKSAGRAADDYLELVKRFPLRPIRSEAEYDRATEVHRELLKRADTPGLSAAESDYADVLGRLVRDYDDQHATILKEKVTPLELLKYIMEQNSMNTTQLAELLGSGKGMASMILNGKRELSKANIRTLAERFKMNPGAFL